MSRALKAIFLALKEHTNKGDSSSVLNFNHTPEVFFTRDEDKPSSTSTSTKKRGRPKGTTKAVMAKRRRASAAKKAIESNDEMIEDDYEAEDESSDE